MIANTLFRISNWKFYFILSLAAKGVILLYFISAFGSFSPEKIQNGFVLVHNDYSYHLQPVDNYIETGDFFYQKGKPFTGRMPGYSFPYLLLRLIFSQPVAISLLIIFQFAFSAFSVYLLGLTAYRVFKSARIFYITFFLFLLSTFTSIFDVQTISESFSVSALVTFLYFIVSYTEVSGRRDLDLVLAGFFLAWAIFLRPYLGLFILIAPVYVFYRESGFSTVYLERALIKSLIFLLPFIVLESIWITRNYVVVGKFIPLEDSLEGAYGKTYSKGWQEIRKFISAWGGEAAYFEPGSEAWWFRRSTDKESQNFRFKEHVFNNTSSYDLDSIRQLRVLYRDYLQEEDAKRANFLDAEITRTAKKYKRDFISNNAYIYYVYKPLMGLRRLVFSSGSSYLSLPPFSQMTWVQKVVKLFYSGLYYVILIFGTAGILFCIFRTGPPRIFAVLSSVLILTLIGVIVFYSDIQEARYFIAAYPLLIIFCSWFLALFPGNLGSKKFMEGT